MAAVKLIMAGSNFRSERTGSSNGSGVDAGTAKIDPRETVAPLSWQALGVHRWVKIVIIGALFYYLFRHEIYNIVHMWLTDGNWSHGFLIPLFSLYFINI